jgi:large subunit ribosomal protein L24
MNIKKGDKIKVLTGKDKGKTGKVMQVFDPARKLVVEDINLRYKHLRPKRQNEKGQRVQFPAPFNVSNAILLCPKCDKPTRVARQVSGEGKSKVKSRKCRKCQATFK